MECSVCYEKKPSMNFNCKHPICYSCLICSGQLKCPICRRELSLGLSEETKTLVDFVGKQHKKITDLENEIAILKNSVPNISIVGMFGL